MRCYVCGQPRSLESIREEKERRREERIAQVNALLFNRAYLIVKFIMAVSVIVSITLVAIICIRIIVNGELDSIWASLLAMGRLAARSIQKTIHGDIVMTCFARAKMSIESIPRIVASIWTIISVGYLEHHWLSAKAIGSVVKENISVSFLGFELLRSRLASNALQFASIVRSLFLSSKESIKYLASIISNIINSASKHFN